jgi:hypothetical protein
MLSLAHRLLRSLFAQLVLTATHLAAQEAVGPNDQARFLAGLSVSETPLAALTITAAWKEHSSTLESAWASLEERQLEPLREWAQRNIPSVSSNRRTIFYLFGGPDFLYADAFFPQAGTYALCGLEPIGPLPDVTKMSGERLGLALRLLRHSLKPLLTSNCFLTRDMRRDLESGPLTGALPIFYILLARTDCHLDEVSFVWLDRTGTLVANRTTTPGVKIIFTKSNQEPQTLFYFTTDLEDAKVRDSGFLKWCERLGRGTTLLKAAAYLMHTVGFEATRKFLLSQSDALLEDDSGIPTRYLDSAVWSLHLFGTYPKPLKAFERYYQPELSAMYRRANPPALSFGIGYRLRPTESTLILAEKRNAPD